jgi:hypothetical protein
MGKGSEIIIEHIVSRFLKPTFKPEQFNDIDQILDLPVMAIRDVDAYETSQIKQMFDISTIRELGGLDPVNPLEKLLPKDSNKMDPAKLEALMKEIVANALKNFTDFEIFRNHVAVANMIKRAWSKREAYIKKKETKIICVGLDNAGKTAILSGLGGKLGITDLAKLKPTKKVDRRKVSTDTMDLFVWDMGGQEDYRRDYLNKPESYFIRTDMIIYVIDMQDPKRYNESLEYLQKILDILKLMGENPYVLAFMHKSDPDILNDPDFQLNTEYVADKLNYLLNTYEFEFDIYTTSIFNFFTSEPRFSKFIKDTLSDKESLNNPVIRKIEGMGDILDSTMNAIVSLANSLGEQIQQLTARIDQIEKKIDNNYMPLPQTSVEKSGTQTFGLNPPPRIQVPQPSQGTGSPTQSNVIFTKQSLGLSPPPQTISSTTSSVSSQPGDTRFEILKDLQGLFQSKRNLDATTPLNKLGSLGKKFDKMKKTTKKPDTES